MAEKLIRPHGGYRGLKAYQLAEIIYDATVAFTRLYLDKRSRTVDQMVQAARSGKQNIAEASKASGTSKKTELKLTNVARASLEELLLDYEDFLRQSEYERWPKNHPKAVFIRKLRHPERSEKGDQSDLSDQSDSKSNSRPYDTYKLYVQEKGSEDAANTLICLIHQANFLLDQLIKHLERSFAEEGGFTERLHRVRTASRPPANQINARNLSPSDLSDSSDSSDMSDNPSTAADE
jgi:restriction system protein